MYCQRDMGLNYAIPESSFRLERAESSRLAWAFGISLALHLLVMGTFETGRRLGWWQADHWPAWLRSAARLAEVLKKPPTEVPRQQEVPLMFVDVSPAQAVVEPPKDAKYYSDKNSKAANPDADKDTETPRINGKQTEIVKTEDVPREKFMPLQPSRPAEPTPKAQEAQQEIKARTAEAPGDLTMSKPDLNPRKDGGQEQHSRPRTVQEARLRQGDNRLPGQKMEQEGGVRHHLEMASLDARATPYGAYDAALVEAISQCWFSLLDEARYASDFRGKVVLHFKLNQDGTISDLTVAESTAGDLASLICQTAVDKPKPYPRFPMEMRQAVGESRNIQFTFYYD